jgi:hypothetical protein
MNPKVTNFASISEAVDRVVKRATEGAFTEKERQKVEERATTRVLGLPVVSKANIDAGTDRMLTSVLSNAQAFAGDAATLTKELEAVSVAPIVILPRKLWEAIALQAGLYTFSPLGDGTVRVWERYKTAPREIARDVEDFCEKRKNFSEAIFLFVVMVAVLFLLNYYLIKPETTFSKIGVVALSIVFTFVVGLVVEGTDAIEFLLKRTIFSPSLLIRRAVREAGGIHKFLWGENTDLCSGEASVRVTFPSPPEDVQETLHRLDTTSFKERLRLTVDKSAITFPIDPIKDMVARVKNEYARLEEEERGREQARRADPIITVCVGQVVML